VKVSKEVSLDYEEMEDHGQKGSITWEKEIRMLVRFASLICIILLTVELAVIPEKIKYYMKILLITILLVVFLAGLIIAYFQLRWINEKRNKMTNLGGLIGLFGLFLTLLVAVVGFPELITPVEPSVESSPIILVVLAIGFFLIFTGVFTEITRLDEPVLYWFRINIVFVGRMMLFIVALVFLFTGNWNWDYNYIDILPLFLFLLGYSLGVATWYHHPYFRVIGTTLSTVLTIFGLYLFTDSSTYKVPILLVVTGVVVNVLIWRKEIIDLIIQTLMVLKNALDRTARVIYSFFVAVKDTTIRAVQTIKSFISQLLRSIWDHRYDILRTLSTLTSALLMIVVFFLPHLEAPLDQFDLAIRMVLFIAGIVLLYATWFRQVNHTIKQVVLAVVDAITRTYRAFVNSLKAVVATIVRGIKAFVLLIRTYHVEILRYSSTFIGTILVTFGFFLLSSDQFWGPLVMACGIAFLYVAWFHQVNHAIKQVVLAVVDAITRAYRAFVNYLKTVAAAIVRGIKAFVLFLRLHYVEILQYTATISGFLLFSVGSCGIILLIPGNIVASLIIMILGIALIYAAWFHQINKLVYQALSFLLRNKVNILRIFELVTSLSLILIALVLPLLSQQQLEAETILLTLILGVIGTLVIYLDLYVFGVPETIRNLSEGLVSMVQAIVLITGILLILMGITYPIFNPLVGWTLFFIVFYPGIGGLLIYRVYFSEINQFVIQTCQALIRILKATTAAIVQTYKSFELFLRVHYIVILRFSVTLSGFFFILVGFLSLLQVPSEPLVNSFLMAIGMALLYIAWFQRVNHVVKQISISIVQAYRAFVLFFRTHYVAILRYSATFIGAFLICWGLNLDILEGKFDVSQIMIPLGAVFLYVAWFHQVNHAIKQVVLAVVGAITRAYRAFVNYLKAVAAAIVRGYKAFVLFLRTYYLEILRYSITIIGFFLFTVSFLLLPNNQILYSLGMAIGVAFLYVTWFRQVNHTIKQALLTVVDAITRVYNAFVNFLKIITAAIVRGYKTFVLFLRTYYLEIIRYTVTGVALVLMFAGTMMPWFFPLAALTDYFPFFTFLLGYFIAVTAWYRHSYFRTICTSLSTVVTILGLYLFVFYPITGTDPLSFLISGFLVATGIVVIVFLWLKELRELVRQAIDVIIDALIRAYRAFVSLLRSIADTIGKTYHAFVLFLHTHYVTILRYSGSTVGVFLFNWGFLLLFLWNFSWPRLPITGSVLMIVGVIFMCLSWPQQIKQVIIKVNKSIYVVMQYTSKFLSSALTQLGQLIVTAIDSIVLISLFVLSVSAVLYGIVLVISGFIDPTGVWTTWFLYNIPFLELLARILQGTSPKTLLGFFADLPSLILILTGVAFIAPGVIIALINFLMRESMKLSNLKKVIGNSILSRSSTREKKVKYKESEN
jgi:hypothetical protein